VIFNESFLEAVMQEPVTGVVKVCGKAFESRDESIEEWSQEEHEIFIEAYALIQSIMESNNLESIHSPPKLNGNIQSDAASLNKYFGAVVEEFRAEASHKKIQSLKAYYTTALGVGFYYEFSQGDLDRVQVLISELREVISSSAGLEKDHKSRLLKRLEKLQSELHKKVSSLDRFWGLVGDAGVALGKLGKDAKPIVDRIKEISDIIWRTQSRAEELPSNAPKPLLENNIESGK